MSGSATDVQNAQPITLVWKITIDQRIQSLAAVSKAGLISVGDHALVGFDELLRLERMDFDSSLFARIVESRVHQYSSGARPVLALVVTRVASGAFARRPWTTQRITPASREAECAAENRFSTVKRPARPSRWRSAGSSTRVKMALIHSSSDAGSSPFSPCATMSRLAPIGEQTAGMPIAM